MKTLFSLFICLQITSAIAADTFHISSPYSSEAATLALKNNGNSLYSMHASVNQHYKSLVGTLKDSPDRKQTLALERAALRRSSILAEARDLRSALDKGKISFQEIRYIANGHKPSTIAKLTTKLKRLGKPGLAGALALFINNGSTLETTTASSASLLDATNEASKDIDSITTARQ